MYRLRAAIVAALFLFPLASNPALAAITGVVKGVVTVADKPQAGAALTLTGEGQRFTTTSNAQGAYVFNQIPFGHYHLTTHVAAQDDRTIDLDVTSDAVVVLDVKLGLMEIASTTVTARAGVGGSPVSVNTLSKKQIDASPNRDSLDRLLTTVPGIVRFSYNEPVAHGFHGMTYEIDGAPLPQATSSNFAEIVDPKNIDSLEVLTGAFPAEYGGSRQGAVVNIATTRLSDVPRGSYGFLTFGGGNYASAVTSLDETARFANSQVSINFNTQRNNRGLDSPTYDVLHNDSSQTDEFLRFITQLSPRSTLAADFSNQLAQFQIPINTDPNNPIDPVFSVPGTDDVQREYDRFFNLNFTTTSKDGNGVFQVIPWTRFTRVAYDGALANDVLALGPNSSTDPSAPALANQIGLRQDRRAAYIGLRTSQFRSSEHHAWKVGVDVSRETFKADQSFACYTSDCNIAPSTPPPTPPAPGYYAFNSAQDQVGTQTGIYAEDKWQPSRLLAINYGLRYDHSTGYTSGWQLSPRIGLNLSDGGNNIFHAYYGRFYAAPQLEDVRADCVILSGCPSTPVYDLQPQRDSYLEMGINHTFNAHVHGYVNIFQRTAVNVLDTTQFLNTPLFAVFNNATGLVNGVELRIEGQRHDGDSWFMSTTVSGAYAGGVSGSTFLFPPNTNPGVPIASPALLAPEDHDQTVAATGAYTHRFGGDKLWYGTLQTNYGTGYPVSFQSANASQSGRLPTHLTFDLSVGRQPGQTARKGLGFYLDVQNLLNHQYVIKIANGFNTTQVAAGRQVLLRLITPF
jgi:outer membrane receptor protein involved in Fe transport